MGSKPLHFMFFDLRRCQVFWQKWLLYLIQMKKTAYEAKLFSSNLLKACTNQFIHISKLPFLPHPNPKLKTKTLLLCLFCQKIGILMATYKLIIEYEGTNYVGWQRQTNQASVQSQLENALFQIFYP